MKVINDKILKVIKVRLIIWNLEMKSVNLGLLFLVLLICLFVEKVESQ